MKIKHLFMYGQLLLVLPSVIFSSSSLDINSIINDLQSNISLLSSKTTVLNSISIAHRNRLFATSAALNLAYTNEVIARNYTWHYSALAYGCMYGKLLKELYALKQQHKNISYVVFIGKRLCYDALLWAFCNPSTLTKMWQQSNSLEVSYLPISDTEKAKLQEIFAQYPIDLGAIKNIKDLNSMHPDKTPLVLDENGEEILASTQKARVQRGADFSAVSNAFMAYKSDYRSKKTSFADFCGLTSAPKFTTQAPKTSTTVLLEGPSEID